MKTNLKLPDKTKTRTSKVMFLGQIRPKLNYFDTRTRTCLLQTIPAKNLKPTVNHRTVSVMVEKCFAVAAIPHLNIIESTTNATAHQDVLEENEKPSGKNIRVELDPAKWQLLNRCCWILNLLPEKRETDSPVMGELKSIASAHWGCTCKKPHISKLKVRSGGSHLVKILSPKMSITSSK